MEIRLVLETVNCELTELKVGEKSKGWDWRSVIPHGTLDKGTVT